MKRFECLKSLAQKISEDTLVVCNLQDTTYEWNHIRPSDANLLRMGMTLVTPIAMGLALSLPHRKVISLDGDGSIIMGLGTLTTVARYKPNNLVVIVFDNESYNSTGSSLPTTTAGLTDLARVASSVGIKNSIVVKDLTQFSDAVDQALSSNDLRFIVAKTEKPAEKVPRPTIDGQENKYRFVRLIERTERIKILPTEEQKSYI